MDELDTIMVGGLFRIPLEYVNQRILKKLEDSNFKHLNSTDFFIFAHLRSKDGIRLVELAKEMNMSKQLMQYLMNQHIEHGYIEKKPDPNDKRAVLLKLSPLGRTAIQTARQVMQETEEEFSHIIGKQEFTQFKENLLKLATTIKLKTSPSQ